MRKQHGIKVTGSGAPAPIAAFADLCGRFHCSSKLMANIERNGWQEPTAIQRQAIPALFEHRELFAIAPTGACCTQCLAETFNAVCSVCFEQQMLKSSRAPCFAIGVVALLALGQSQHAGCPMASVSSHKHSAMQNDPLLLH